MPLRRPWPLSVVASLALAALPSCAQSVVGRIDVPSVDAEVDPDVDTLPFYFACDPGPCVWCTQSVGVSLCPGGPRDPGYCTGCLGGTYGCTVTQDYYGPPTMCPAGVPSDANVTDAGDP